MLVLNRNVVLEIRHDLKLSSIYSESSAHTLCRHEQIFGHFIPINYSENESSTILYELNTFHKKN